MIDIASIALGIAIGGVAGVAVSVALVVGFLRLVIRG